MAAKLLKGRGQTGKRTGSVTKSATGFKVQETSLLSLDGLTHSKSVTSRRV